MECKYENIELKPLVIFGLLLLRLRFFLFSFFFFSRQASILTVGNPINAEINSISYCKEKIQFDISDLVVLFVSSELYT